MEKLKQVVRDANGQVLEIRDIEAGEVLVRPEQVNKAGSMAAAIALASGKSLSEALDIGAATPNTETHSDVLFNDDDDAEDAPDRDEPTQKVAEPDPAALKRRYLCARINCMRNLDLLNDEDLMDAAQVLDLPFVHAIVWKNRVTS